MCGCVGYEEPPDLSLLILFMEIIIRSSEYKGISGAKTALRDIAVIVIIWYFVYTAFFFET